MLTAFILFYLGITLAVGLWAARRVKTVEDFALAGRKLPFFMAGAALFATWFGSETVLGASEEYVEHGLSGVIEEPIGAALCLIIVGLFYARKMYRTGHLTFNDLFRERFGRKVEVLSAVVMIPSFFTWIAAQFLALGLILNAVTGINLELGMFLSCLIVLIYTVLGGMWSVSITDTVQMFVIIMGLIIITGIICSQNGWSMSVSAKYTSLLPEGKINWWEWFAAWITVGLGSVASQDVYQRVVSAKSEQTAVRASLFSGFLYLIIGILPLVIAFAGSQLHPELYAASKGNFLNELILKHTPVWVQILFFGALISAILSTASGALLAPGTVLAENVLKPMMRPEANQLKVQRWSIVAIAFISLGMAFMNDSIFELVGLASSFGLVSLFLPYTATLFIAKTPALSVVSGMILGLLGWIAGIFCLPHIPAIFSGLTCSFAGLIIGYVWPVFKHQKISKT